MSLDIDWESVGVEDRKRIYLEGIGAGMDETEASALAGINRVTSYRWRKDPEFKKLHAKARGFCVEALTAEAERRAMRGSDRLLEFLLCNYAPDKFRKAQDMRMSGSLNISQLSEEELRAELAALTSSLPSTDDSEDEASDLI